MPKTRRSSKRRLPGLKGGSSPLWYAVVRDDIEKVKELLDEGADPDTAYEQNSEKKTVLIQAIELQPRLVETLLQKGADPNKSDAYRNSPLYFAISNNNYDAAKLLLQYGAYNEHDRLNTVINSTYAYAPVEKRKYRELIETEKQIFFLKDKLNLHTIITSPESEEILIEKARKFLEEGADLEEKNLKGQSPLHAAVDARKETLAIFLLDAGANANVKSNKGTCMNMLAALDGLLDLLKRLHAAGNDINCVNTDGYNALYYACYSRLPNLSIVQYLVEHGVDINKISSSSIAPFGAIFIDSTKFEKDPKWIEIAKYLLEKGAKIQDIDIVNVVVNKSYKACSFLLEHGANPNAIIKSANSESVLLKMCSKHAPIESIQMLVEKGADVNYESPAFQFNFTPLSMVVSSNVVSYTIPLAEYLLGKGANPNKGVTEHTGIPPFVAVVKSRPLQYLIPLFLEKGANPNTIYRSGFIYHILYDALRHIHTSPKPAEQLITAGANINYQYSDTGNTILMDVIKNFPKTSVLQAIQILLKHGADVELKNKEGRKAEDFTEDDVILEMLGKKPPMWEGWSRSDIAFLNNIFTTETRENAPRANDFSLCPVCLKTVVRPEGCMHMRHDCATQTGFYHKGLYAKYKMQDGNIHWCTICNRIGYGVGPHFEHYTLDIARNPVPKTAGPSQVFDKDCATRSGGGGLKEKYHRFQRLREVAYQFNNPRFIGNKRFIDVMDVLVEAMWDAPLVQNPLIESLWQAREWNRSNTNFLAPKANRSANNITNIPVPDTVLDPVIHPEETGEWQNALMIWSENIVQFRHPDQTGVMHLHDQEGQQIAQKSFALWLSDVLGEYSEERFGYCWQYIPENDRASKSSEDLANLCTAKLYPKEVRIALGLAESPEEGENAEYRKLYEGYRKQFTAKFK